MVPKALITGITGQDGSYLCELLLAKGYEVHGLIRRSSNFNTRRIDHLYQDPHELDVRLFLHYGDLTSMEQAESLIRNLQPDEIYNLGAQSHVGVSFEIPEYTGEVTGMGAIRLLEAVRRSGVKTRFYQASSSEMFGSSPPPQNEFTPFLPCSPYACAKVYAYYMTGNYRDCYGIYACNGILFNHESPRRGQTFVTKKTTKAIADIMVGKQDFLYLGNLSARRDWGYAPEYVEAMWLMLQQDAAEDFVIGTGESHSVQEFVERAFAYAGLEWEKYVRFDSRYIRPSEVNDLSADSRKARDKLKWEPKIGFDDLVMLMVDADLSANGLVPPGQGYAAIQSAFAGGRGPGAGGRGPGAGGLILIIKMAEERVNCNDGEKWDVKRFLERKTGNCHRRRRLPGAAGSCPSALGELR